MAEEFSKNAEEWMKQWGHFGITYDRRTIKGWALINDDEYERVYYDANDLRKMAEACIEIANVLNPLPSPVPLVAEGQEGAKK